MSDHASSARILLSIKDIMAITPLKRETVYRLLRTGELASVQIGRERFVRRGTLDAFLADREAGSETVVESTGYQRGRGKA